MNIDVIKFSNINENTLISISVFDVEQVEAGDLLYFVNNNSFYSSNIFLFTSTLV